MIRDNILFIASLFLPECRARADRLLTLIREQNVVSGESEVLIAEQLEYLSSIIANPLVYYDTELPDNLKKRYARELATALVEEENSLYTRLRTIRLRAKEV